MWTKLPDLPLINGRTSWGITNHVWTGSDLLQAAKLSGGNYTSILCKYNLANNSWTLNNANTPLVQAGATTLLERGALSWRFSPTGSNPLYTDTGGPSLRYYKKR
jgi:hypothetical protein